MQNLDLNWMFDGQTTDGVSEEFREFAGTSPTSYDIAQRLGINAPAHSATRLTDIIISPNDTRIERAIDQLLDNHCIDPKNQTAREAARASYWNWLTAAIETHILDDLSGYAHGPQRLHYNFEFDETKFQTFDKEDAS